jgi:hypothetical protein
MLRCSPPDAKAWSARLSTALLRQGTFRGSKNNLIEAGNALHPTLPNTTEQNLMRLLARPQTYLASAEQSPGTCANAAPLLRNPKLVSWLVMSWKSNDRKPGRPHSRNGFRLRQDYGEQAAADGNRQPETRNENELAFS